MIVVIIDGTIEHYILTMSIMKLIVCKFTRVSYSEYIT